MSDTSGIPNEPAAAPAADGGVGALPTDPAAAAAEEEPLHPSWNEVLDGMPDLIREPIAKKAREDQRRVQAAIEGARGNLPPEWQSFYENAKTAGVSPTDLVNSYNAAYAIREDPIKFQRDLTAGIQAKIDAGELTLAQGQQLASAVTAKAAADASNLPGGDDPDPLESPEVKALKEQLAEQGRQLAGVTQTISQQQKERQDSADKQAYDAFFGRITSALDAAGLPGAATNTQIAIARQADALLEADPTGKLTEQQAITTAIEQLKAAATAINGGVRSAQPQPQQVPVGGGGAAVPVPPQAGKFASEAERDAAMIAAAAPFKE